MSTFALIHGAGDSGWSWHLVAAELEARGHRAVAPDLPTGDASATLADYADLVVEAVDQAVDQAVGEAVHDDAEDLIVVGHSFGAFTAPLVAARRPASRLVLVAGMVPRPGEPPDHWWAETGYAEAMAGRPTYDNPHELYYHDVPAPLTDRALVHGLEHPSPAAGEQPWPMHAWPDVQTSFVLCTEDRLFPPMYLRRIVRERLGLEPTPLASGHCAALARPQELTDLLVDSRPRANVN